jgi:valyl-tRNA synthetase
MSEPLSKTYEPDKVEQRIYELWLASGAFHAVPDGRPTEKRYVVMMPLPNVTGALHMGHAIDNAMQDLLIRWHRMMGDNTLWMPGTDHAGIATQAVVEKRLKELEGLTRHDVGREGLVERIWRWKDQYQARIIAQQQRMGFSCDWQRQRFTMDAVCARAVRHTFFRMFTDGLIFRGKRLVNWDPFLQTTISDDEVYHEKVQGHFWHLRYPVIDPRPGEPEHVVVATTRPETMLGDTAVAVHPDPERALDERIAAVQNALGRAPEKDRAALDAELDSLVLRKEEMLSGLLQLRDMALDGRLVNLPLLDRPIPLICDEWAKPELGSGCVKITPAHDHNDYDVWTRHRDHIDIINILNPDGTLNESAGPYTGQDRFEARDNVVEDLDGRGLLAEIEDREVEIGHSDRSKSPVEPYLSDQWFVHMGDVEGGVVMGRGTDKEHTSPGLVQAAMDAVTDGRVSIHPERYTKTYLDWLSEKRDWPISRQLWWGHRIPVWSRTGTWGELDVENTLGPLMTEGVAVRVLPLDDPTASSRLAFGPRAVPEVRLDADLRCRVDVCLLEDSAELVQKLSALSYERDPDVLDTWFSSALWPHSTLGWPDPSTAEIDPGQAPLGPQGGSADCLDYYYPGSCLVTARDIITLWVARMVLAGLYNLGDIPFTDVFIHANILDGKGERMSKSKGNGIDPVDIIETYGTDAMRYVLCDMQTGTQDIRLPVTAICPECGHENDLGSTQHGKSIFTYVCGKPPKGRAREGSCGTEFDVLGTMPDLPAARLISKRFDIGRGFCTKLWNSARFAFMNLEGVPARGSGATDMTDERSAPDLSLEDRWILDQLSLAIRKVHQGLADYNPAAALHAAREFFWSELCDWYLELIKPRVQDADDASGPIARQVLALCLDQTLRLLHPFIPFITEHLWQRLGELVPARGLGPLAEAPASEQLINATWPRPLPELEDPGLRERFADLQALTRAVREVRQTRGLPPRQPLRVTLRPPADRAAALRDQAGAVVTRLAAIEELVVDPGAARQPGSASKVMGDLTIFVHDVIDDAAERERLQQALARAEKEIGTCEKKLGNPKFVERAPAEVVQEQRDRLAEYQAERAAILEGLGQLDG